MKPDKVDHYLNKRKEREARLAVGESLDSDNPHNAGDNETSRSFASKEQISHLSRCAEQLNSPGAEAKKYDKLSHKQEITDNNSPSGSNQQPISQMPGYQPRQREIKRTLDSHNEETIRVGYERVRNAHQMFVNQNMLESLEPTYSGPRITNSADLLTYESERAHTFSSGFKRINLLEYQGRNVDSEFQSPLKYPSYPSPRRMPPAELFENELDNLPPKFSELQGLHLRHFQRNLDFSSESPKPSDLSPRMTHSGHFKSELQTSPLLMPRLQQIKPLEHFQQRLERGHHLPLPPFFKNPSISPRRNPSADLTVNKSEYSRRNPSTNISECSPPPNLEFKGMNMMEHFQRNRVLLGGDWASLVEGMS
jgi:hypothetical protein